MDSGLLALLDPGMTSYSAAVCVSAAGS